MTFVIAGVDVSDPRARVGELDGIARRAELGESVAEMPCENVGTFDATAARLLIRHLALLAHRERLTARSLFVRITIDVLRQVGFGIYNVGRGDAELVCDS